MQVIIKDRSNSNKPFLSFPCAMAKIYCARTSEGTAKEKRPTSERPKHGPLPVRKSLTRVARASTRARQGAGGGGSPRAANRSIRSRRSVDVSRTSRPRAVRASGYVTNDAIAAVENRRWRSARRDPRVEPPRTMCAPSAARRRGGRVARIANGDPRPPRDPYEDVTRTRGMRE